MDVVKSLSLMDAGFVKGVDVLKLPDLMDGKEYKGHTKTKGISLEMLLLALLFHYTPELGNQLRMLHS